MTLPDLNPNKFGILNQRGFLPGPSAIRNYSDDRVPSEWDTRSLRWWSKTTELVPKLLSAGKARNLMQKTIKDIESFGSGNIITKQAKKTDNFRILNYLMRMFSFLGHAWVWEDPENPMDTIPAGLAVPWHAVAKRLGRPPVLSYDSYVLQNWRLIDEGPIELGNVVTLQNFLGGLDEEWFILVHVEIETKAGAIPRTIASAFECMAKNDLAGLENCLKSIALAEEQIYRTLLRMPERCDPYIYYTRVRPWIHGWKDNPALPNGVVYEGVEEYEGKPQKFRGETGAQSSIIPLLDSFLEVEHDPESRLTTYLLEMRDYMPPGHRQFIEEVERLAKDGLSIKKFAAKHSSLRDCLDSCYHWLELFRNKHLEYAATYVQKQSQTRPSNPTETGTGGTPFMPYLKEHLEDTREAKPTTGELS